MRVKGSHSMEYFWYTSDTIPEGLGFSHFGGLHMVWLGMFAVLTAAACLLYRRMGSQGRGRWRKAIALLLVADELFKLIPMLILGTFEVSYLPFHLCSINIFLILRHAWKPGKLLDNFLYTVCIPGALAALLFPTWTKLPAANYMCIHSFSVHILLAMYPIVLTAGGDIRPEARYLPKVLALLASLACVALVLNFVWDTNFMFLMDASKGNPLYWFKKHWGSHLWGFPVILTGVILVMYGPVEGARKHRKKVKTA